jgi:superfamily II DNA or RNA helicase
MLKQKIILNESLVVCDPPSFISDRVVKDNTFPNPVFSEAVKYGRQTRTIPDEIQTFRFQGNDLVVERGYCREFMRLCNAEEIIPEIEERRSCPPDSYPDLIGVSLREYQQRAIDQAEKFQQGVIVAPTGAGKSIMGLELIRRKQTRALILVHRAELANQWKKNIESLFGFTPGRIGGGSWEIGSHITIGMAQTLAKNETKCREIAGEFGLILCDECHHAPARTFAQVIGWLPAKYRYGLSATPTRRDQLDCLIFRVIGPELASISREEVEQVNSIVPASIVIIHTGFDPGCIDGWHEFSSSLNNHERNRLVLNLIPKNKSSLILVDRIAHAVALSEGLKAKGIDHVLAHGSLSSDERSTLMDRIKQSSVTVGTTSLLGEGLDVSHWETLILAAPISSEAKLLQAIGRIVRPSQDKEVGTVYDLKDACGLAGYSLNNRINIYKKHGIQFEFYKGTRKPYGN